MYPFFTVRVFVLWLSSSEAVMYTLTRADGGSIASQILEKVLISRLLDGVYQSQMYVLLVPYIFD